MRAGLPVIGHSARCALTADFPPRERTLPLQNISKFWNVVTGRWRITDDFTRYGIEVLHPSSLLS
jgi:hypothetical protein